MKNELNIQNDTPIKIVIEKRPEQINISGINFESIDRKKLEEGAQGKCLNYSLEVANKNSDVEIIHGVIISVNEDNTAYAMAHAWNRIGKLNFDVTADEVWVEFEKSKEVRYATIESFLGNEQPLCFSDNVNEIVDSINAELIKREKQSLMNQFYEKQKGNQKSWRKTNISSTSWGWKSGNQYEHIIPKAIWRETLFGGIRIELPAYLTAKNVQAHTDTHNLLSSWVVCVNLYFPLKNNASLRVIMLRFFQQKISPLITEIIDIELEFAFPKGDKLNPKELLGETGGSRGSGQTSPDIAFLVKTKNGDGIILTECKYTEHSFYGCSARKMDKESTRINNPDPKRCLKKIVNCDYKSICHQSIWGRKYLNIIELSDYSKKALTRCPAATAGYQLLRQQALAEGIAKSGRFSLVASTVSYDARNSDLKGCLKSTGINDFQTEWAKLFNGKAIFKTWTHQEWVQFVRENQVNGEFEEWLRYLNERYGY